MKVWITRHGQTDLNKKQLMQGVYDEPLNETGIAQAEETRKKIGDMKFDAVYCSPLKRAKKTAMIIGGVSEEELIVDPRIIEVNFARKDDEPATVLDRLKAYHEQTEPLVEFYRQRGKLVEVPDQGSIEATTAFLLKLLEA